MIYRAGETIRLFNRSISRYFMYNLPYTSHVKSTMQFFFHFWYTGDWDRNNLLDKTFGMHHIGWTWSVVTHFPIWIWGSPQILTKTTKPWQDPRDLNKRNTTTLPHLQSWIHFSNLEIQNSTCTIIDWSTVTPS